MESKIWLLIIGIFQFAILFQVFAVNIDTQYTANEKEALQKFKGAVANITHADYQKLDSYLIHFLRKKGLNVDDASTFLQENLNWRRANGIDSILQEQNMINTEKSFPISADGVDIEGRPTLTYIFHKWDIRRFILAGKADEYRRYQIYLIEKITRKVYELALKGKDVSQFNVLIDLSSFNTRQHACLPCLPGMTDFVSLIISKYPNSAHHVIFVNAPRSFETILGIVKRILDPVQRRKLHVYGYDKVAWRTHLSKLFNDDQLPTAFGGNRIKRSGETMRSKS